MRPWRYLGAAGLLSLTAGISIVAPPANSATTSVAAAVPVVLPSGHQYTVTLLTGDVVTVHTGSAGCPSVSVRPAHPGDVLAKTCGRDGHVHVLPASLGPIIKHLDPSLFDVTALIQDGYDDAHSADVPLIVRFTAGHSRSRFSAELPMQRSLPSIDGVAVREPKNRATSLAQPLLSTSSSADVDHVWLDRRVSASAITTAAETTPSAAPASRSVARDLVQIGAPTAWKAGETGKGVRVAVLDTGIDPNQPDLAGKVVASKDFTDPAGDAVDHFGHGTHVAATIAGSGVESDGRFRGVAPDAELLNGKVLDDTGFGTESQVIAGMQWAAPLAKVVNLSLGGDFSDGTDPESMALNALSAQYGTLFVVAAGNDGPGGVSVESPGSAAAALTVGAVDSTDTVADFSSRGPETGSQLMKPEIVAPGVDIISARAAGTDIGVPIDQWYTELSGTSMATPHVAGAAAILAQAQPTWRASQLKEALAGGADPVVGDAYAQGAGRVDIPHALADPVLPGAATADLGTRRFPQTGTFARQVSWTDPGTRPVTLQLDLHATTHAGTPVPSGSVRLSRTTVTVQPGGTASVRLILDQTALATNPGYYDGVLSARANGHIVRTPVAFFIEPPSFDLTLRQTLLPHSAPDSAFNFDTLVNLDDPDLFNTSLIGDLSTPFTLRVPAGRYSVTGNMLDTDENGLDRDALLGISEIGVDAPTTVTFDGAAARPVTASIAGVDTEVETAEVDVVQAGRDGIPWDSGVFSADPELDGPQVFATPMPDVDVGSLHASEAFSLRSPGTEPSPVEYSLGRFLPQGLPADPSYRLSKADASRLARIDQTFNRLDSPAATTGFQRYLLSPEGFLVGENIQRDVPVTQVDYVTPGLRWADEAFAGGSDDFLSSGAMLEEAPFQTYAAGSRVSKVWFAQPLHPDWNDAAPSGGCQPQPVSRTRGNLHVDLSSMVDVHQRFNCIAVFWPGGDRSLTLFRNGQQLAAQSVAPDEGVTADFTVPAAEGTYRLVYDEDAASTTGAIPISTHTTTAWTFRSTGPAGISVAPVALLSVDYALPLDSANRLTGRTATFSVRQARGVPAQQITQLTVWTSANNGRTWTQATGVPIGGGRFIVQLPAAGAGQSIALRVRAIGSAGSEVDQTIMDAYRTAG